ncbi:hypothetical protein LLH23_18360 [bacterium]|nr:hypothetical protein [bacterium]
MIRPIAALTLLLVAWPVCAQTGRASARALPASHRPSTADKHQGHDAVSQEARLSNDTITYGLLYNSCWDPSHGPGGADGSAYLGMPQPSSTNWYHGGFLRLKISGDDLGVVRLGDWWVSEEGPRAAVKMHFDHPRAHVLISALLYPDDGRLFVTLGLSPKTKITALDLSLICYPSYFTYWNKRNGDRKALTATQTYPQADGKKITLDPAAQWWTAFTDTIFDPARGEGDGGCAVAFVPDQVSGVEMVAGSYACTMDLKVKPDTRQIRLCFWDFNKRPNQEALTRLTAALPGTLEQLRALNPLPLAVSSFDIETKAAGARSLLGTIPGRQALEQKLADQSAELARLRQELLSNQSPDPAAAEKAIQEQMAAFEQLLWDVRFFALIHG